MSRKVRTPSEACDITINNLTWAAVDKITCGYLAKQLILPVAYQNQTACTSRPFLRVFMPL